MNLRSSRRQWRLVFSSIGDVAPDIGSLGRSVPG